MMQATIGDAVELVGLRELPAFGAESVFVTAADGVRAATTRTYATRRSTGFALDLERMRPVAADRATRLLRISPLIAVAAVGSAVCPHNHLPQVERSFVAMGAEQTSFREVAFVDE